MPETLTPQKPRPCPVCGNADSREIISTAKRRLRLCYRQCVRCSVVFRDSFDPVGEEFLYDYQAAWSQLTRDEAYPELNAQRYFSLLEWLESRARGKRLLDVGCGKGHFVYRAQEAGWEALGIEVTSAAVETAQRFGAPVVAQDFLQLTNREFDVITMFELLEHLSDPGAFVSRAAELMEAGGLLYLTTPNVRSLDARIAGSAWRAYDPEHLVLFSPGQLANLVQENGFDVVRVTTRNLSPTLLKRALLGRRGPAAQASSEMPLTDSGRADDQRLRKTLRQSPLTSYLLDFANAVLGMTELGSTTVLVAQKSESRGSTKE